MAITYPATQLIVKVEIYLGTVLGWVDISTYVLYESAVEIFRGLSMEDAGADGQPNSIKLVLDNTDKRFSPRNPAGPYFGKLRQNTRMRVSYDAGNGPVQRAQGRITDWVPLNPPGGPRTVPLEAVDIRTQIQRGTQPLNSPIYNSTIAAGPVVYAPLEDGDKSSGAQLSTEDGSILTAGDIDYSSDSDLPGSKPTVTLTANSKIIIRPPTTTVFHDHWQVDWFYKLDSAPAAITNLMRVYVTGSGAAGIANWDLDADATTYKIFGVAPTGSVVVNSGNIANSGLYIGQWVHARLMLENTSSTQYQWQFVTFPASLSSGSGSFINGTGLTGRVGNAVSAGFYPGAGIDGMSVSHLAIYDDYNFSAVDQSGGGYVGESPTDRFLRLCAEEGIDAVVRENGADAVAMGVQRSDDFMANVRECLDANEGYLDVDTTGRLRMTSRTYLENRAVAMTVDQSARRAQDIVGAETSRLLVNSFTAERDQGGSVTVNAMSGPLNVNDPDDDPDGVGKWPASETYNLNSDAGLADHASYRVNAGTVDHPAVEKLRLHFGRSGVASALLATWMGMDTFQRIQVTNPPTDLGMDTLDQIAFGWTERIDQKEITVDITCRPAAPFNVGVIEDATQRLDSADSYLLHGLSTSDTSIRVANTSDEVDPTYWGHRDGNYPVRFKGEDVTVTALTNDNAMAAPSFVAAGTGASSANTTGTISPGLPAGMQKGDLMLLFASARGSGAATVNTPTGYLPITPAGNVMLFGKIHTGTESAPSVGFTGGAASQDGLAQMAAFRNVQLIDWPSPTTARVLASSSTTTGAQQNIDLPAAVAPVRQNALAIYIGWRQDDWTSAGLLGGSSVRIGTVVSTAGNDAAQVWDYDFATDVEDSISGFWTITGGATALTSGIVVWLDCNVQVMTVTRSTNGVTLAHDAGEQVRVKNPIVLALPEA